MDGGAAVITPLGNVNVAISGESIIVTTQLMMDRHYIVTILAYNFAGKGESEIFISKLMM